MPYVSILGPLFWGLVVDSLLVGAVAMQAFTYFRYQETDSRPLAAVVAVSCFLSILQLAFTAHANYHYVIASSDRPDEILRSVWSLNVEIILTVIITFLVRVYLTVTRVWQLGGRNWILVGVILVFLFSQLGLGFGLAVLTFIKWEFSRLPHYFVPLVIQMACAALGDLVITASLVYFLHRSRTGVPKTESIINRLIAWSVNTAAITGLVEIAILISWITMRHTLLFVGFHLIVGQVYLLTLLAMLNHRRSMRSDFDSNTHIYTTQSRGSAMMFRSHHIESTSEAANHGPRKPWLQRAESLLGQGSVGALNLEAKDPAKRTVRIEDVDEITKPEEWLAPSEWSYGDVAEEVASTTPRSSIRSLSSHPFT